MEIIHSFFSKATTVGIYEFVFHNIYYGIFSFVVFFIILKFLGKSIIHGKTSFKDSKIWMKIFIDQISKYNMIIIYIIFICLFSYILYVDTSFSVLLESLLSSVLVITSLVIPYILKLTNDRRSTLVIQLKDYGAIATMVMGTISLINILSFCFLSIMSFLISLTPTMQSKVLFILIGIVDWLSYNSPYLILNILQGILFAWLISILVFILGFALMLLVDVINSHK